MPARINRLAPTTLMAAFVMSAVPLPAQRLSDPLPSSVRLSGASSNAQAPGIQVAPQAAPRTSSMVLGGVVGAVAGGLLGVLVGVPVERAINCRSSSDDMCGIVGGILGGIAGESLGLSLGVHLAGGRRGNYGLESAVSLGLSLAGLLLATGGLGNCDQSCAVLLTVGVPFTQLIATTAIEQAGARR